MALFCLMVHLEPFLALLIINYVLIHLQEISNQFTWSLFWHFLKKIKKKFFLLNINLHKEKIKVKFSQIFWMIISPPRK